MQRRLTPPAPWEITLPSAMETTAVPNPPPRDLYKLQRATQDLEAQLAHARNRQDQIRRRMQERMFASDLLVRDLRSELATAIQRNSEYRERLAQLEQELSHYQDRLTSTEQERSLLTRELQGVYRSLSWRITSPLRTIKALLLERIT